MKRLMTVVLVLIMLSGICISGCTKDENNVTDKSESSIDYSTDMQLTYHTIGANVPMTKSDKGYYYVGGDGIVIFVDKESKKATPLCTKPNCLHDDYETCDAYFDFSLSSPIDSVVGALNTAIQYNEGSLYMICGEYDESYVKYNVYLLRTSPDGTNRERVTDYLEHSFTDWFIHRGYFYYSTDSSILRRPLDSLKSDSEVVFKTENFIEDSENTYCNMLAYDNYLYFYVEEVDDNENFLDSYNVCVNIDTLEAKKLKNSKDENAQPLTFFDNKFLTARFEGTDVIYEKRDLDGENPTDVFTKKESETQTISSDGRYIYLDNRVQMVSNGAKEQVITIYDLNMKQVDSFTFTGMGKEICNFFNPQDNEYFLLESNDDEGNRILVMADKSQIGSIGGKTLEYTELCKLDWNKNKKTF
ncbi:MAG: hypothetical protein J1E85_00530 [Ruminococcus sp.]|nr:hypothetical protein [Ruminococcus sp.]